ncbi:MAG: hypothetical protein ABEJ88_08955 [Halobacterium sp.]
MDPDRFREFHAYGAVASLVAVTGSVAAFALAGPESSAGLLLGLFGSLGAFYFVGSTLSYTSRHRVLGEELLRGVAWYFLALVGWSSVVTTTDELAATPVTVVGLPALTALGVAALFVAVRRATGSELRVQSRGGQLLVAVTGSLAGAFLVGYLVLARGRSPWLAPAYLLATAVGLVVWWRHSENETSAA